MMGVNEGSLQQFINDIGDTGKLTYIIVLLYGTYLSEAFVVFVIHTVSYTICDNMSKR